MEKHNIEFMVWLDLAVEEGYPGRTYDEVLNYPGQILAKKYDNYLEINKYLIEKAIERYEAKGTEGTKNTVEALTLAYKLNSEPFGWTI